MLACPICIKHTIFLGRWAYPTFFIFAAERQSVMLFLGLYFLELMLIVSKKHLQDILYSRTTVVAAAAFLDAFQKVADMATNTRGKQSFLLCRFYWIQNRCPLASLHLYFIWSNTSIDNPLILRFGTTICWLWKIKYRWQEEENVFHFP